MTDYYYFIYYYKTFAKNGYLTDQKRCNFETEIAPGLPCAVFTC